MSLVASRYGEFEIIDDDMLISKSVRKYGEWSQIEINLLAEFIASGDCVIDVGAFIGTHSRAFSDMVGVLGKVISFEPRVYIAEILQNNANLASNNNIHVEECALGKENKTLSVPHAKKGENYGGVSLECDEYHENGSLVSVKVLDQMDIDRLDFIKVDVEGMEIDVLDGAHQILRRFKPVISCECNSIHAGLPLLNWADNNSYNVFGVCHAAFNHNNFNNDLENIFGISSEVSIIFLPSERVDIYGNIIKKHGLCELKVEDDLVLLMLHKAQYPYEVLSELSVAKTLGVNYPSPLSSKLDIFSLEMKEKLEGNKITLQRSKEKIAALEKQVSSLDVEISCIVKSKSWLLTKPLRFIGQVFRVVKQYFFDSGLWVSYRGKEKTVVPTNVDVTSQEFIDIQVSVVLPVYRDVDMTKKCIDSALPSILDRPDFKLVIINDFSPDAGMQSMLEEYSAKWPEQVVFLNNERNLGFVSTVNKGVSLFSKDDVVLLNSDVIVPRDWLQRLKVDAYSKGNVATVTPISNNTTICTFPHFFSDNPIPFDLDVDSVDEVFRSPPLACIETPTGIGFCMYIRRDCLDGIGGFDESRFGRGYGEENDFCQRAIKRGWVNLITPNMYAFHKGGVSFGDEKDILVKNALEVLDELHPQYHADVQSFISADPLKVVRVMRYSLLLASIQIPKVLHVTHGLGGGVAQHIEELSDYYSTRVASFLLKPQKNGDVLFRFGVREEADEVLINIKESYQDLIRLISYLNVTAIHYHHLLDHAPQVLKLSESLELPHFLTVHDYYLLNANPTLTNKNFVFPGEYTDDLHNPLYPMPDGVGPNKWRGRFHYLVESAVKVIFPSMSTKTIFDECFSAKNFVVAYHLEVERKRIVGPVVFQEKKKYRIVIVGAIGKEKGSEYLEEISAVVKKKVLPYEFIIIGFSDKSLVGVEVTGAYPRNELTSLIHDNKCDLVFFPARWPETYSYTLSNAIESGLPIVAPRIGAFAERLAGREMVMLYDHLFSPDDFVCEFELFVNLLASGKRPVAPAVANDIVDKSFYTDTYEELLGAGCVAPSSSSEIDVEEFFVALTKRSVGCELERNEVVLRWLWKIHAHPLMRWVGLIVPYQLQRAIKKKLSLKSMHDILR